MTFRVCLLARIRGDPLGAVPPSGENRVDAELDPGGRGKDWVGKGLGTVGARLATVRIRLNVFPR